MSPRYLLILADDGPERAKLAARISKQNQFALVFSNARVAALAHPSCPCVAIADAGCILGSLFPRHGPARRVATLTKDEVARICSSDGQTLLSAFWGGYVAAIAGLGSVRILRDPSGNFPCYYADANGFLVLASDAQLLVESGVTEVSIDFGEIGRILYRAFVPAPATALRGIRELLAGFALRFPARTEAQEPCWSPWDYAIPLVEDSEKTAERLSRTVTHCVQAWASTRRRLLLSVSGGLDSSIVAASVAKSGADAVCLTIFTDDPGGDERMYARALCDHLGLRLIERPYRLEDVDITEPLAAHLPRPRDRTDASAYERVHDAVASEIGADAFVTGNGGDHVFGYSQSAAPLADRYLSEGFGPGIFASLADVCRQTGCSMFDAAAKAWRMVRSPVYRVRPNPLFLARDFAANLGPTEIRHSWLDTPAGALPGKAVHIGNILRAQPNLEPIRDTRYAVLNPLMSQPIVEACLAIPSWEWRAGGRDRALARSAFARDLPPLILSRRVKGTPSRFAARLLDHFRPAIRERLLGGRLAEHGIIDAAALEHVLAGERPIGDLEQVRILELVNAESWIGHWSSRARPQEPASAEIKSAGHARPLS